MTVVHSPTGAVPFAAAKTSAIIDSISSSDNPAHWSVALKVRPDLIRSARAGQF
jgi:hypothetical protein